MILEKTDELKTINATEQKEEFIMLPTVDFCFKELMQNEKVRQGILAALLKKNSEEIAETELLPTILRKQYPDEKYGVLDVRVRMKDGKQINFEMQVTQFEYWPGRIMFYLSRMYTDQLKSGDGYDKLKKCIHVSILDFVHFSEDQECYHKINFCDTKTGNIYSDSMEIHVLELPKLPPEDQNETGLIRWMRFLGGKTRKEFEKMAEQDEYIGEAYEVLKHLSADEKKKIEYEAREKAIRDYNTQMFSAEKRGVEQGIEKGRKIAQKEILQSVIKKQRTNGKEDEEIIQFICENMGIERSIVEETMKEME